MSSNFLLLIMGLSFAVSLAVGGFMIFAGINDAPDHRSSHSKATPTGGGLGIIAALGLVPLLFSRSSQGFALSTEFAQILSLIWATGFLGLMDDIFNLSAWFKLFVLAMISAAAVWTIGPISSLPFGGVFNDIPVWLGWGISMAWIFGVMNVVNFMDGSNGLMLVVMGLASFFLAMISVRIGAFEPFLLLIILTAAMMGLAIYNLRTNAVIFSGDVGSLSIGFSYAVAVLWISRDATLGDPIYIGPVLIMPFLADAFFTMMGRARRGEKLTEAHRSHLYQRMIKGGASHLSVACVYGILVLLLIFYTQQSIEIGLFHYINYPILPAVILSIIYILAGRKFK